MKTLLSPIIMSIMLTLLFPQHTSAASAACLNLTGKMRLVCEVSGKTTVETRTRFIQGTVANRDQSSACEGMTGTVRRDCFVRIRSTQEGRFQRAGARELYIDNVQSSTVNRSVPNTTLNQRSVEVYKQKLSACALLSREAKATCIGETRREYFGR